MRKYLTLVNKDNEIKSSYLKNIKLITLKNIYNEEILIEEETATAYKNLKSYLKKKEIEIGIESAYRSIEDQQKIKEEMIEEYGSEYAEKVVAKPKQSEHHTGLAIDICIKESGKYITDNNEVMKHLEKYNAILPYLADFGFILRYPKGKEAITKYPYEPWHLRYVGKIPAKIMTEKNWTLEEYLTKFSAILYVNKPKDMTSFDVVDEISNIYGIKKVGHTGTLDPLAEGVLIVTLGGATKVAEIFLVNNGVFPSK